MLRFLSIRHLAVVDSVEVEFEPGLNVLTGETGAGKSILVEAVGLLLGARASGDLVRTGEDSAVIEAIFERGDQELIIKREITAQGRSRAYVNGSLATASALRALATSLIEIHGQHENQTLLDPEAHLATLDAFGGLGPLRRDTEAAWDTLQAVVGELAQTRRAAAARGERMELASFQLAELERADLQLGEDDELAAARQVLASAERVERLCEESYAALYERDGAVLAELGGIWRRVSELADVDPQFQSHLDVRDGIKSQLEDLALFLRRYADSIEASPARLQRVEDRLALLERLKRKYGPSLHDVVDQRDRLRRELSELQQVDARLTELEGAVEVARSRFLERGRALSGVRRAQASRLSKELEAILADLAMQEARFEVRFSQAGEEAWGASGIDRAEFYLSANPGEEPRPMARIASGGELSRIMMAIKTLLARTRLVVLDGNIPSSGPAVPGLIFDEVDAGIGGRVADVVGRTLHGLASVFQVLCITHLPQIAAAADAHFLIEKRIADGRTRATVTRLTDAARTLELARMLGGAEITDVLKASAEEMLAPRGTGAKGETKPKGESESRQRAKAKARSRPPRG
jgi:DNA repair protein RecN (Recombination protein N)